MDYLALIKIFNEVEYTIINSKRKYTREGYLYFLVRDEAVYGICSLIQYECYIKAIPHKPVIELFFDFVKSNKLSDIIMNHKADSTIPIIECGWWNYDSQGLENRIMAVIRFKEYLKKLYNIEVAKTEYKPYKCYYSITGCKDCESGVTSMFKPVMGLGFNADSSSEIMFIDSKPKSKDVELQKAFSSTSGNTIRRFIKASRLDDVSYLTCVIKCPPIRRKTPSKTDILNCTHHLDAEIREFKPKIIVLFGKTAMKAFNITFVLDKNNYVRILQDDIYYIIVGSIIMTKGKYEELFNLIKYTYRSVNPNYIMDL